MHYKADIAGGSLKLYESRIIAGLLLESVSAEQWKQAIEVENVLQKTSQGTAKRQASLIRARLKTMTSSHWILVRDGPKPLATQDATIVAYFASFERGVLRELASQFPDLAERLLAMANKTEDLLPVARACWYHRDQRGSWSIKAVLPTIAALDYEALEVKHGGMAQDAWIEAADPSTDPVRKWALEEGLKAYCQQDTWAMILLARQFSGQGSN